MPPPYCFLESQTQSYSYALSFPRMYGVRVCNCTFNARPSFPFLSLCKYAKRGGPRFHFRDNEEMYPFGTVCIQSLILLDMLGCEYVSKIGHMFAS